MRLQKEQFDPYHFYESKISLIEDYVNQQSYLAETPKSLKSYKAESCRGTDGKTKRVHLLKDRAGQSSSDKKKRKKRSNDGRLIIGTSNTGSNDKSTRKAQKKRLSLKMPKNQLKIKNRLGIFNKGCSSSKAIIEQRASLLSFDEDNFYHDHHRTDLEPKSDKDMITSFFQSRKFARDVKKDNLTNESADSFRIFEDSKAENLDDGLSVYSMDTFGRCSPTGKVNHTKPSIASIPNEHPIKQTEKIQTLQFPRVGPSAFKYSAFRI